MKTRALTLTTAIALLLLLPGSAQALKLKTNRGGVCVVNPVTVVQGSDRVTYGLDVGSCETRNGVKAIASLGFAIEGNQVVSSLQRKVGVPPYENIRTSKRLLPDTLPDLPLLPDLPALVPWLPDLPPLLPELPLPGFGGEERTYTRIDYSVQLERNRGKKAKRKPERWRKRSGCERTTGKLPNDTLICQAFAPTN